MNYSNNYLSKKLLDIEKVCHYTSPEGLEGILEKSSLRFTDYHFLNDEEEGKAFDDIIKNLIKDDSIEDEYKKLSKELLKTDLDRITFDKNNNIQVYDYYVFCCSENIDSLPMWTYYVKNNIYQGYNIGIDIQRFIKNIKEENYELFSNNDSYHIYSGKVEYDQNKAKKELKNYILKEIESFNSKHFDNKFEEYYAYSDLLKSMKNYVIMKKIFFKKKYFEHEQEYRIVIKISRKEDLYIKRINHFIKNGIFVPYLDIKFNKSDIKFITLAPSSNYKYNNEKISESGLRSFLIKKGYQLKSKIESNGIDIKRSKIRIRY